MKKRIKKIAMFATATVAIGVASLTSCTKEEESLTNNVPAMELKNGEPTVSYTPMLRHPEYLFWTKCIERNSEGGFDTVWCCKDLYDPRYPLPLSELCAIRLGVPQPDTEVAHMESIDGMIKRIVLYGSAMNADLKDLFTTLVNNETIIFAEDCFIEEASVMGLASETIPAGEYPIHLEDDNFVITISE